MKRSMIVFQGPTGVELVMHTGSDEPGVHHILQDVVGWYGGVGVTGDNTQRSLSHGLFPEPSRRTGRALTVKGTLVFEDRDVRALVERQISGLFWDGELGTVTVDDGRLVLSTQAKLDGEIDMERWGTTALKVAVPLLCPDPFLYAQGGTVQVSPPGAGVGFSWADGVFPGGGVDWHEGRNTSARVVNQGNADAYPVITVQGSWPNGFRLTDGRNAVEYPHAVFDQSPVVVDMRAGSVTVKGADQTHKLTKRQWFKVGPESAITVRAAQFAPSTGWADIVLRSTYI